MIIKMSQARFNDLIYLTLKKLFLEPIFKMNPRDCDIGICMAMIHPEIGKGPSPIVMDNPSLSSHSIILNVDTDRALKIMVEYMADHWFKTTFSEQEFADMKTFYEEAIIPAVQSVPEEQCGGN